MQDMHTHTPPQPQLTPVVLHKHIIINIITILLLTYLLAYFLQVASLDALRGQASVVQLKDYGVTSSVSGARQWVLVFPQYAGSMREWRLKWRGKGLNTQDLPVYLRLFIRVSTRAREGRACNPAV
mgnify:CR=1 FL=1